MRVLHVISGIDPQNGGTTTALLGLTRAQRQAGIDASVVATWQLDTGIDNAPTFIHAGIPTQMIGRATGKLSRHPEIVPVLRQRIADTDLVHVHGIYEEIQVQACRIARQLHKPYLITPHGLLDRYNMSHNALAKRIYLRLRMWRSLKRAAAIHVATDFERRNVERLKLRTPILVVPFGLDLAEFAELPPRGRFRARYPEVGDRPIVLFLGRIQRGKGLEVLVPAFARIAGSGQRAAGSDPNQQPTTSNQQPITNNQQRTTDQPLAPCLVIAGPDEGFQAEVQRQIDRLGLGRQVLFTGMLRGRERIEALVDAAILAAPSFHESFGLAVAESLAAGTPVLVSDQVGLADVVGSNDLGRVTSLAPADIANALQSLLTGDSLAERGARARKFVVERYDWGSIGQQWSQHLRPLAGDVCVEGAPGGSGFRS